MRMTMPLSVALLIAAGMVGTGCSAAPTEHKPATYTASVSSAPMTSPTTNSDDQTAEHDDVAKENGMRIHITIGGQRFGATLAESAAARDLVALLPVTVDMTDHGGLEKTGPLPSPLSLDGQPKGADPEVGDLGYYAPGHDLVLYYGDQSYFPGIVILGRLEGDAAQRISKLSGSLTARVEAQEADARQPG